MLDTPPYEGRAIFAVTRTPSDAGVGLLLDFAADEKGTCGA